MNLNPRSSSSAKTESEYVGLFSSPCVKIKRKNSPKEYYIHKDLLGHISIELYNHINNDMKEGKEKCLELEDVEEETIVDFLKWAYTPPIPVTPFGAPEFRFDDATEISSTITRLYGPARQYVFADRFNIPRLKEKAFWEISSRFHLLDTYRKSWTTVDIQRIIELVGYVFDNLPQNTEEPLVLSLSSFIAWALEDIRRIEGKGLLWELFERNPHLVLLVMMQVRSSDTMPKWHMPESPPPLDIL